MCVLWPFLETAVHLAYSMSSVLEPQVWLKEALTISIQKCLWFLEKQKAGHLCSYAQVNFPE